MNAHDKEKKIESISNEVKDFHPLLKELFKSIVGYEVFYTHGTNENGADFIIEDKSREFDVDFIGVVVKIGKILKGSGNNESKTIIGQINECFNTERIHPRDAKKISLNKVFLITNSTISNNAEEEIKESYRTQHKNIKTFDRDQLINLIDKHLPDYWGDNNYRLSKYMESLRKQLELLEEQSKITTNFMGDFYIKPTLTEYVMDSINEDTKKIIRKKANVNLNERINKEKFILLQAQMGGGKSKLIRELAKYHSNISFFAKEHIIPFILSYKDYVELYNSDFKNILSKLENDLDIETIKQSTILILMDSFDEFYLKDYQEQHSVVRELINKADKFENIKVVLAKRSIQNGNDETDLLIPEAKIIDINPLSSKQLAEFVKKLCESISISDRIYNDIKNSNLMSSVSTSPIAAIILVELLKTNSQDLPCNMTELYSKYLELMLGKWDVERGLLAEKEYIIIDAVMLQVAKDIMESNRSEMSYGEYEQYFSSYIKPRVITSINSADIAKKSVDRNGVLYYDSDQNIVVFKHRTFIEFYYAKYLKENGNFIVNENAFNPYWMNSYFFFLGMKKDCPEILKELVSLKLDHHIKDFIKIINIPNMMLAAYMTPRADLVEIFKSAMINLSNFYNDLINKKFDESHFYRFSKLQLVAIFTYLSQNLYGYKHFLEILEETYLEIQASEDLTQTNIYALFFISTIGIELDNYDLLENYLEEYKQYIPIELKYLLLSEKESMEIKSVKLNRLFKNIRRSFDSFDTDLKKYIYSEPIKKYKETK